MHPKRFPTYRSC